MSKGAIEWRRAHTGVTRVLTNIRLRSLMAKDQVYRIGDSNDLATEVRPTGAKFWRCRYRYAGKPTMLTLGEYPATGLAGARTARDNARAQLKAGTNPVHVAPPERAPRAHDWGTWQTCQRRERHPR